MTTIWMDPPELLGSATMLSEQAYRIQETVTGTRAACACTAPRSLVGWIDSELQSITAEALGVAIGYVLDALDVTIRAHEIDANQSLATTHPGLVAADNGLAGLILRGTMVTSAPFVGVGAPTGSFVPGGAVADPEAARTNAMMTEMIVNQGQPSLADLMDRSQDGIRTQLAPSGLTYSDGGYVDSGGDRSSSLAGEYRDPETGKYDL